MGEPILVLFLVLLSVSSTVTGDVLKPPKLEISTTQRTDESNILVENKREKHSSVVNADVEENVYLEDVFYKLKSLNWSRDQEVCLNQTLWLLSSLKNFSLWAVWEWDSISSEPTGLLYGNHYQLGNFDECMNQPWEDEHSELSTQYCLAKIKLEKNGHTRKRKNNEIYDPYSSALDYLQHRPANSRPLNELTWGVCVPATCSQASVERLMGILLTRSHLGTTGMTSRVNVSQPCQRSVRDGTVGKYDTPFIAFWCMVGLFVAINIVCTILDARNEDPTETMGSEMINAFSLTSNAKNLLKIKRNGSEVLYGIRFFTMCFIVFDHTVGIHNAGPIGDGLYFDKAIYSLAATFLIHDDLLVDSYFFLSGFLVMFTLMNFKKPPNFIAVLIKRYIRISVAFALIVFYMCAVFPYTGNGPLWPTVANGESDACKKNWWLSLLMVNNYVDSKNICLVVSWYIPCDFHFFVITVTLYFLYHKFPIITRILGIIITVGAVITPGVVNYLNKLPAIQLFTFDFLVDPRASDHFHLTYIKSHTRMAAYIIGLGSGYLFTTNLLNNNLKRIGKTWSIIGAVMGLVLMVTVMTVGSQFLKIEYTQLQGAVYAALDRPLWTCGLALFVLSCSMGDVPYLNSFLSWYPWAPLSRLTYGLYLVHSIFITRNVFVARNSRHNDLATLMNSAMGTIVWGCLAALAILLLFEAPINNLAVVFMKPRRSKTISEESLPPSEQKTKVQPSLTTTVDVSGQLKDNLPNTILQYSSKI